jgi:hypothetical protein
MDAQKESALALAWNMTRQALGPRRSSLPSQNGFGSLFLLRVGSSTMDEKAGTAGRRRRLSFLSRTLRNDHIPTFLMRAAGDAALPGSCQLTSHFALVHKMDV